MSRFFSGNIWPKGMTRDMGDILPIYVIMVYQTLVGPNLSINTQIRVMEKNSICMETMDPFPYTKV